MPWTHAHLLEQTIHLQLSRMWHEVCFFTIWNAMNARTPSDVFYRFYHFPYWKLSIGKWLWPRYMQQISFSVLKSDHHNSVNIVSCPKWNRETIHLQLSRMCAKVCVCVQFEIPWTHAHWWETIHLQLSWMCAKIYNEATFENPYANAHRWETIHLQLSRMCAKVCAIDKFEDPWTHAHRGETRHLQLSWLRAKGCDEEHVEVPCAHAEEQTIHLQLSRMWQEVCAAE